LHRLTRINAQLPLEVVGSATMVLHTPGGTSNNLDFTILPTALVSSAAVSPGPLAGMRQWCGRKTIKLVTPANPIHRGEVIVIYATGLGLTSPALETVRRLNPTRFRWQLCNPRVSLGGLSLPLIMQAHTRRSRCFTRINALTGMGATESVTAAL